MNDKDYREDNKKRMMIALAILLGLISSKEQYDKMPKHQLEEVKKVFDERQLEKVTDVEQRLSERDIQIQAAEKGIADKVEYYKIVGTKDEKTCPDCAQWQGKTVTLQYNPFGLPTVQDFINGHGFHPNCRCSLQELDVDEIPIKEINPRYEQRKQARPDIYNSKPVFSGCVTSININIF